MVGLNSNAAKVYCVKSISCHVSRDFTTGELFEILKDASVIIEISGLDRS